jgi:hypothetical protein
VPPRNWARSHVAGRGETKSRHETPQVTHRFVGGYVVTDATHRKLRGTDGWISLILATEGRANVEVFDS